MAAVRRARRGMVRRALRGGVGLRRHGLGGRPDAGAVADTVLRLAVLLQAGIAPAAAWRHLAAAAESEASTIATSAGTRRARSRDAPPAAPRIVERLDARMALHEAIRLEGGVWTDVAAAWEIAVAVGAPLAESLRGLAESLRDAHAAVDDVRIALAEPAGTARLMLWLPLVGVALGTALGFDTVPVLLTNPIGLACLGAGVGLLLLARGWTAKLVRSAEPTGEVPGIHAELTAIALSGGVSLERARVLVSDALAPATRTATAPASTDAVLELSRAAGVPAVELLRASAAAARHRSRTDGRLRAARLASKLLLPLGVCTLPAFLLLGVAPLLLSVLKTTPLSL